LKTIIAGGRDYHLTDEDFKKLDQLGGTISEVVSGCARGVDTAGEVWAKKNNIPVKKFPADWEKFGKSAGYRRNQQMAKYADAVVLFPGGKGTGHMYDIAKRMELIIYDFRET
jgi:predicted Rossmann-fold nucleotide-binding protein